MAPDARPASVAEGGALDSISTTNGGLQLRIPLWSIKQRGNLSLSFTLRYNSPSYSVDQDCNIPNSPCILSYNGDVNGVYVMSSTDVTVSPVAYIATNSSTGQQYVEWYYWQVITPDSGTHDMVKTSGTGTVYRAADGTGWMFDESNYTLTSRDGVRYVFQGAPGTGTPYPIIGRLLYVEDTNGNRIRLNYNSSTSNGVTYYTLASWTDTLGRTIPASVYSGSSGANPLPMPANGYVPNPTTDFTGCTGPNPIVSATLWTPPGASGPIKYCFADTQLNSNFWNGSGTGGPNPTHYEMNGQNLNLQSVVLLDGSTYTFQYSPIDGSSYNYGELSQITLPAGGTLGYTWAENFTGCPAEASLAALSSYNRRSHVTSRVTDANDAAGAQTWLYSLSGTQTSPWTFTVADPLGDTTTHTITNLAGNCSMYETEADFYNASQGLLKKVTTSYQMFPIVDYFTQADVTTAAALPITENTIWANGAIRQTTFAYDSGFSGTGPMGTGTFAYGDVVTQTDSDYGTSGTPGAVLKTSSTSYWALSNPSSHFNMIDRPSSVTVTDNVTGTTQTTRYGYDETALVSGNASTGWDAAPPSGSVRGNLTSVSRYWDTTGGYLTSTNTYTDTGLISTATEPSNSSITPAASSSYSYSSTYDGGFLTAATDALGHSAQYSYSLSTGHVVTATDENGLVTHYYYDGLLRLSSATHPGGTHNLASSIGYQYPDPNTRVTTNQLATSAPLETNTVRYDGLGRVSQTEHSDPEGDEYVDTTYDALSRKATVSTPYRTTTDPSYGLTTYSYDALGRDLSIKNPDSTTATYSYAGATTRSTNESNGSVTLKRLSRVDGLGRLISACEVSSATPTVGTDTPTNCGLEIAATGYLTTYVQTVRGLTSVQQGSQTRSFVYDSLGHVTDSTNPELGHINYTYDNDGNLVTKTSPLANAPSGSDSVTINYKYDALHRMLSKTYSGTAGAQSVYSTMPSSYYNYDEATSQGKTLEQPVGRLTSEYTVLAGTVQTRSVYSYDTTGKPESHYQCVLTACASSSLNDVEYQYDGAGNVTSLATPRMSMTAAYNDAGHLTSITPGWTPDSNHPSSVLSSATYAPNGGWSTADFGNGTVETYAYGPRWMNSMKVTDGAPPSGTASSGSITISGSEQSKTVVTNTGAYATGWVTVNGQDGTHQVCVPGQYGQVCNNVPDTGTISITVNGFVGSATFGPADTDSGLAAKLATALNASGSPVSAASSGGSVNLTSNVMGPAGNYSLTISNGTDFWESDSGGLMTGGANPATATIYDSGTITATINGVKSTVSYSQSSTPASLAQSLATIITGNSNGNLRATASNATISIASVQIGSSTNWTISTSVTFDSTDFSSGSFALAVSGMSGGSGGGGAIYSYSLTHASDGQITKAVDFVNGTWAYTFDEFNRLLTAKETASNGTVLDQLSWDYDRYGNRWHQNLVGGTGMATTMNFAASNNRSTSQLSYDVAGNVLNDSLHAYVYDAENRIASVSGGPGYIYDAEGRRVGKTDGTVYTVSVAGGVLDEVNGSTWKRSEIYAGARHILTVTSSTVVFVHSDWLGTERARSNMSGQVCQTTKSQPYGDNVAFSGTCNVSPDFFTGKPRDTESNLDDFGARYFSSQWGRWMSADWTAGASAAPYATLSNPQSLNLYAYVGNDPIDGQDPDGHMNWKILSSSAINHWLADSDADCMGDLYCAGDTKEHDDAQMPASSGGQQGSQDAHQPPPAQQQGSSDVAGILSSRHFKYNFALDITGLSPNVQFNTQSSNVHPEFTPSTATALNSALTTLNKNGIVPTFNSSFRTWADQARMRSGGSGSRPAGIFSWHEAANAVDIQPGRSFGTIVSVMEQNGFTWGGNWTGKQYDPVHFELQRPHSELFVDILKAQSAWSAQQQ
jgi:RHS repeat-associated protein